MLTSLLTESDAALANGQKNLPPGLDPSGSWVPTCARSPSSSRSKYLRDCLLQEFGPLKKVAR